MSPLAQRTIEADLDRLERQRVGYALALASSQDERTRSRHERTLSRLDEEIAALLEALETIAYSPPTGPRAQGDVGGVPIVEHTTEMTAAEYEELRPARPKWMLPVAAVAAVGLGVVLALLLLPDPPATKPAAPVPAPVVVSSPVPPDSDDAPAR